VQKGVGGGQRSLRLQAPCEVDSLQCKNLHFQATTLCEER
jgi:hypothetical protein